MEIEEEANKEHEWEDEGYSSEDHQDGLPKQDSLEGTRPINGSDQADNNQWNNLKSTIILKIWNRTYNFDDSDNALGFTAVLFIDLASSESKLGVFHDFLPHGGCVGNEGAIGLLRSESLLLYWWSRHLQKLYFKSKYFHGTMSTRISRIYNNKKY